MTKKFTVDWFDGHIPKFNILLSSLKGKGNLNFLEIGSFEGRSSCFFYETFIKDSPGSTLTCVDTWEGSMEHGIEHKNSMWDLFNHNISEYDKSKLIVKRGYSRDKLKELPSNKFDFIYVDGSHTSRDVLGDAVLSFDLLKINGIMTFDDYQWTVYEDKLLNPKTGIDAFLTVYKHQLNIIESNLQATIVKIKD